MSNRRAMMFSLGGLPPIPYNLFIGGVASTLSTASLLATKLGVSSSIITDYTIVGSDIKCVITTPFSMPNLSWKNDANVTYFLAYGSIITSIGIGNFENFANLKLFYCEGNPLFNTVFNARTRALTCELPQLTILAEAAFYTTTASNKSDIFYMPLCVQLGTIPAINENCFFNIGSGSKIYVDPFLQTCNAGSPDADLVYAVSRGAIVRYVTNFTAPNQITDLSAGTIYNTSIQLNFTAPSSTNAIDYYELYIDGVLQTQRITASGQFISGLTSSTSYSFTLKAVDIFYNKSVVSNSLSVSTTNRAAVDADAIAYITASSNTTYQDIIDDMFVSLKSNSLYTKLQAFYPFLGTTAAQHKWNGKNPLNTDGAFRLVFTGGATFSNNGYQLNGSSYANSHFAPSTNQVLNSNGFTVVCGTNNSAFSGDTYEVGSQNGATQSSVLSVKVSSGNLAAFRLQAAYLTASTGADSRGIFTATKQSSTVSKLFKNGASIVSGASGGTLPTLDTYIGAINLSGSAYGYSNQRIQFTAIHEGLSDAEVVTLHTIIDVFETALGRKTW